MKREILGKEKDNGEDGGKKEEKNKQKPSRLHLFLKLTFLSFHPLKLSHSLAMASAELSSFTELESVTDST